LNLAQFVRFGITVLGMIAAGAAFMLLDPGWGWLAALALFLAAGAIADLPFRRLGDVQTIRDDLEDRVRNPE
jgi:hypothetical protein